MVCLVAGLALLSNRLVVKGHDVQFVATRAPNGWIETLYAVDARGEMKAVLSSPNAAALPAIEDSGAVQRYRRGLYTSTPDFGFTDARIEHEAGGQVAVLTVRRAGATFTKRVHIPDAGRSVRLELDADFGVKRATIHALLLSYVFTPTGVRPSRTARSCRAFGCATRMCAVITSSGLPPPSPKRGASPPR